MVEAAFNLLGAKHGNTVVSRQLHQTGTGNPTLGETGGYMDLTTQQVICSNDHVVSAAHPVLNFLKDFLNPRRIPTNYEKLPQSQLGSSTESLQEEGIPSDSRPQHTSSRPYCCYESISHSALKIHFKGDPNKQVECDTPLEIVADESEAQLVIWPSANYRLHGFWSLENAEYYPEVAAARRKLAAEDPTAFDFEATYRTTSDFPLPYAYSFFDFRKAALPFETRRQDKLAAAFISNCSPENNRTDILKKLTELLPGQIDSFGDST
ncbi:uncharacterized protein VP01_1021g1 [Puccinia sorghi]|uniref:Uncharacterized protein n=1 Tax=Puccinia sorghi TaxID=27349 RepID=A0A0L6VW58_9BASI|nr:uncharacterized protein VP01_1021g1 [Puccinia sorghi]